MANDPDKRPGTGSASSARELAQAGNALIEWFNNQELSSSNSLQVMSKVIAKIIVDARPDTERHRGPISDAIDNFTFILVNDINARLYNTRK